MNLVDVTVDTTKGFDRLHSVLFTSENESPSLCRKMLVAYSRKIRPKGEHPCSFVLEKRDPHCAFEVVRRHAKFVGEIPERGVP